MKKKELRKLQHRWESKLLRKEGKNFCDTITKIRSEADIDIFIEMDQLDLQTPVYAESAFGGQLPMGIN